MIKVIKYTNNEDQTKTETSSFTSQAHREYHEGKYPYYTENCTAEDVTAQAVYDIKVQQRVARLTAHNPKLIAEIGVINEMAMDAESLTEEQYTSFKSKIAVVKDHLTDAAYDKAISALSAADLTEIPSEVKAAFIAKIQAVVDAQTAELNPPDSHLPPVVEEPEQEPEPEEEPV